MRRRMDLRAMASDTGQLLVQVFRTGDDQPVRGANITITYRGDPENVIFTTRTGEGGFFPGHNPSGTAASKQYGAGGQSALQ